MIEELGYPLLAEVPGILDRVYQTGEPFVTHEMRVALDRAGKVVWSRHLGQEISPFEINWGHSSSPTLHGNVLLLLCDHAGRRIPAWLEGLGLARAGA